MRNKIDFGIDLGTTNSAIAKMQNGVPTIIKSPVGTDTLPTCVHFTKRKDTIIGANALNVMKNDYARALKAFIKGETNSFIEFKRTMGTTTKYESSHMGKSFSSDELSAEMLKSLRSLVIDEDISSIVITVPAKFLNPQMDATINAAKMLGFKQVELLQEPVAAATAFGLSSKKEDGFWLVFDFGGGTFDAAIIKSESGILSVKDTDGDNWLGGKNLDDAIIDKLIIPNIQENFSVNSILEDSDKKELLRSAVKYFAEEAKIQLSFKDSHNILSNLGDLPFEDENGEEPEIDVNVTQKDLDDIFSPIFQKSIDIVKDLLKRNNLKGADLGALMLVGGPTYSPILRKMLKEQITDKIDTSADPMTVVAQGAALYASTISITEEVKEESRDKTKIQLDLKYEATTVETDELISLKVLKEKTTGTIPEKVFAECDREGWSSGKVLIGEKATVIDLLLEEGRSNSFKVNLFDDAGNRLDCEPSEFSILQGIGGLDSMQTLAYNIGIAKYFHFEEKDLFLPIKGLEKNKRVPAVGVNNELKTRVDIRPGMKNDIIRIPIYQGEYDAEGTNPILNNFICDVIVTGELIPSLLPAGSDVHLTIKIDKSQSMKVTAYFPVLDYTEEMVLEINQTEPPKDEFLSKEISKAKEIAKKLKDNESQNSLDKLSEQLENEKGSPDGKLKILESLRKQLMQLETSEKTVEWPEIEKELKEDFSNLDDLVIKIKADEKASSALDIDVLDAQMKEYRKSLEQIVLDKDIREAKRLKREIGSMDWNLRNAVTDNAQDVSFLKHIDETFDSFHWKDVAKARQLCNQGLKFAMDGNNGAIRGILVELVALMPDNEKSKDTLG